MTKPVRLQLSRRKGFDLQALSRATNGLPAVNVARPTVWGNRFRTENYGSAVDVVDLFEHDTLKFSAFHPEKYHRWIAPLRGKNLACWCSLDQPCHADVLLEMANAEDDA